MKALLRLSGLKAVMDTRSRWVAPVLPYGVRYWFLGLYVWLMISR